jgi:CRP-like cAMP-binding protein
MVDEWVDDDVVEEVAEPDNETKKKADAKAILAEMSIETKRLYRIITADAVWFMALDDGEKALLATLFKPKSFSNDEVIFEGGQLCSGFHIVTKGTVRVLKGGASGAGAGVGEYFGMMQLLAGTPYPTSVLANEGAETMFLPTAVFDKYRDQIQSSFNSTVTDILKKLDFAADLHQEQHDHLLASVKPLRFNQGERVINQGEVGDRFYIILSGEAVVTRNDGEKEHMITHLHQGQWFGETALIYDDPRGASVSAATSLQSLYITKQDFEECKEAVLHAALENLPLLMHMSPKERNVVLLKLQPISCEPGANIMRQGETGDKFFVITKGEVEIIEEIDGSERVLTHLYEGAYFGEMALVGGVHYTHLIHCTLIIHSSLHSSSIIHHTLTVHSPYTHHAPYLRWGTGSGRRRYEL